MDMVACMYDPNTNKEVNMFFKQNWSMEYGILMRIKGGTRKANVGNDI